MHYIHVLSHMKSSNRLAKQLITEVIKNKIIIRTLINRNNRVIVILKYVHFDIDAFSVSVQNIFQTFPPLPYNICGLLITYVWKELISFNTYHKSLLITTIDISA